MRTITAIIPVRTGSTRLKNKNVAPFVGTNLLINKINQLKQVKEITRVVVSSDSDSQINPYIVDLGGVNKVCQNGLFLSIKRERRVA